MKKRLLYIILSMFCVSLAAAEYTTLVHHKDGRVFAIATDRIDSITHTTGEIDIAYYDLTDSIVFPPQMKAMMELLLQAAAGVPNSVLCSEGNDSLLFSQEAAFERDGEPWTHSGLFTLIDDDTMDEFIPSSHTGQSLGGDKKVGGYFSLIYPFLKSLSVKHGVALSCGLAMEGQRVGLTGYATADDECAINENGRLVQQLVARAGWDCLCHSMTARLAPEGSVFIVDSLNSADAKDILANGKWAGLYSFTTAGVYDRQTRKNYTITGNRTQWVETPEKYIQPYCFDRKTNQWIYNESFPIDYQLGEWKRRADSLGFTYPDILVHWGSTTSSPLIRASRRYFSHSVDPGMGNGVNNVPLGATIHRISTITAGIKNAYSEARYKMLKEAIDQAEATHGWLVLMGHFYEINYYNGYLDDVTYPEKDEDYNPEWVNPLVTDEIRTMDENNYWETPPARLGISNWGEWRPAKGTQIWCLYTLFEYALEKKLINVSPSEGIRIMGNKVNIGMYRDKGLYPREKAMELLPIDHSYYVVGADGSIKYKSVKE